jgi:hypothetical protein
MNDKMLNWLQNWVFQNFNGKWEKKQRLLISTIDNPGWLLTLKLENSQYENKQLKKITIDRTEYDWCHCLIDNKEFVDAGGPFNLNEMLNYFINFFEEKNEINNFHFDENEIINWMENWYYQQCDEDWEHTERFRIKTTESGWFFSMFLEDTICEDKTFDPIEVKKSEKDWFKCYKNGHSFEGKGGIFNLVDILNIFINWVEECEKI